MKKILLVVLLTIAGTIAEAQKMYVWCPNEQTIVSKPGAFSGVKINLVITDKREFGSKTRDKCSTEELVENLASVIRRTYPSIKFTLSKEKTAEKGTVSIQIDILAYAATFSTVMWNASAEYAVTINDYRKEKSAEQTLDIAKDRKFYNAIGFTTAKSNLNKTYAMANTELVEFIYKALNSN